MSTPAPLTITNGLLVLPGGTNIQKLSCNTGNCFRNIISIFSSIFKIQFISFIIAYANTDYIKVGQQCFF